jgi:hypothetical protein
MLWIKEHLKFLKNIVVEDTELIEFFDRYKEYNNPILRPKTMIVVNLIKYERMLSIIVECEDLLF